MPAVPTQLHVPEPQSDERVDTGHSALHTVTNEKVADTSNRSCGKSASGEQCNLAYLGPLNTNLLQALQKELAMSGNSDLVIGDCGSTLLSQIIYGASAAERSALLGGKKNFKKTSKPIKQIPSSLSGKSAVKKNMKKAKKRKDLESPGKMRKPGTKRAKKKMLKSAEIAAKTDELHDETPQQRW